MHSCRLHKHSRSLSYSDIIGVLGFSFIQIALISLYFILILKVLIFLNLFYYDDIVKIAFSLIMLALTLDIFSLAILSCLRCRWFLACVICNSKTVFDP